MTNINYWGRTRFLWFINKKTLSIIKSNFHKFRKKLFLDTYYLNKHLKLSVFY